MIAHPSSPRMGLGVCTYASPTLLIEHVERVNSPALIITIERATLVAGVHIALKLAT
jgi:hypothetical protein